MKTKRIFSLFMSAAVLCSVLLSAASCGDVKINALDLTADVVSGNVIGKDPDEVFTQAELDFSLSLFKAAAGGGENMLISPVSVLLALSIAANGAGGETREEMERVLGLPIEELNEYLYTYVSTLPAEENITLKTANSLWFREGNITVNKPFLQAAKDYYGASVYSAPFDNTTVKDINAWVKQKTDGFIDKALDKIDAQTVMYVINTVLFDARWANVYEKNDVKNGKFTTLGGEEKTVKFMSAHESNCFYKDDAAGFIKYYSGGEYAFVGVLPDNGDVYGYIDGLTAEKFADYFVFAEGDNSRYAEVYLPKFEYEYNVKLNSVLSALGMPSAFGTGADFSGIGETGTGILYIDEVLHKTFICVDELGTKAGAATSIGGGCGAMPPSEEIHFDRPFVYFIVDTETGLPVFMGTVTDIGK